MTSDQRHQNSKSKPSPSLPIHLFWRRFTLRHARLEWMQTALLLFILALGVGTFLSIRMANRAAVEGFRLFTESLKGPSDWIVQQEGTPIPVEQLRSVRDALGTLPAALFPVVEQSVQPVPPPGKTDSLNERQVRMLGLDLVQIRSTVGEAEFGTEADLFALIEDPRHLLISPAIADEWGTGIGDTIPLILQGREKSFTIRGILPEFRDGTPLPRRLVVADIGTLLRRMPLPGIDRVEIIVPEGPLREAFVQSTGEALRGLNGPWQVRSPRDQQVEGAAMTAAFRLNLTVLSLIALLVGMYLIAQTLDATVSRRRGEIATLRSLGIRPVEIYRFWLSEAALYGIAAGVLGLLAGTLMATFTVDAVTGTVRALYRDTVEGSLRLTGTDILLGMGLGIVGSLLAAWLPARDAASTPPAQFLRLGKRIPPFPVFEHPWMGLLAVITGAFLLLLPPWERAPGAQVPVAGYATALLWLTGGTLIAAKALQWVGRALHLAGRNHAAARLAGSRLGQPTSRHQLALSGFFVAIGMAAAMAFLIASFEHTVTGWLKHRLQADLFISSVGFQGSDSDQTMPGALLDELESMPGIRVVDRFTSVETRIREVPTTLGGIRFDLLGDGQDLLWIAGPRPEAERPPAADATGYANENLQRRAGLRLGDVLTLETPAGTRRVWIGGFHADYARDNGLLLVDLPRIEDWYQKSDYATAAAFLDGNADPGEVQSRLRAAFPGLAIRQNAELMEAALFIFRQTFAVTYALQVIGLIVALTGLCLSLLSLLRESGRELSLQRTLGMNRREIALSTALEGTGVALTGLLTGLALSVALGCVLIYVINRQSFGWTLQAAFPFRDIALLAAGVLFLGYAISYFTGRLYLRKWKQETL